MTLMKATLPPEIVAIRSILSDCLEDDTKRNRQKDKITGQDDNSTRLQEDKVIERQENRRKKKDNVTGG